MKQTKVICGKKQQMTFLSVQKPLPDGRKIIVPRADHTIRCAMQPGAPASKNSASAASKSPHARLPLWFPEEKLPFLRRILPPPFCYCCAILCAVRNDCETRRAVVQ